MGLWSLRTPREPRDEPVELSALAEAVKQEAKPFKAGQFTFASTNQKEMAYT